MEKVHSNLTAIVIGSTRHKFIHETTLYLDRINIPYTVCEDVYSAVAMMATTPVGTDILVVGCFMAIAVENMRVFSLMPKNRKVFFCCIVSKWVDTLHSKLTAEVKTRVFLVNCAEQIDDVIKQHKNIEEIEAIPQRKTEGKDFATRIASLADSFFLTQAEQDALLGVRDNADTKKLTFVE